MDKNLIIELIQDNNCNLTIIDNTNYSDLGNSLLNYVTLELLIYNEDTKHYWIQLKYLNLLAIETIITW